MHAGKHTWLPVGEEASEADVASPRGWLLWKMLGASAGDCSGVLGGDQGAPEGGEPMSCSRAPSDTKGAIAGMVGRVGRSAPLSNAGGAPVVACESPFVYR